LNPDGVTKPTWRSQAGFFVWQRCEFTRKSEQTKKHQPAIAGWEALGKANAKGIMQRSGKILYIVERRPIARYPHIFLLKNILKNICETNQLPLYLQPIGFA
jgi:hypothetical protein